jgi:uncharacterized protein YdeI (YjbR/CyaY-like superfamily)
MATDPLIDRFISEKPPFAKPILEHLRALIHQECPEVVEDIKWSRIVFLLRGKITFNLATFSSHCGFGFWNPKMQEVLTRDGIEEKVASGSFGKITKLSDLPSRDVLAGYIREARRLANDPSEFPARKRGVPKPEIPIHPDFAKALKRNGLAADMLKKFSPSHRREYLEWIAEAKRPETREKRISAALQWLKEGKHLHWKYE